MPTYYKRDNTGTTNWNLSTSWSTVSSTSATNTGTFPSAAFADPVIFDANSSNVTVNVASVCTSVTCTAYTGQITFTNNLSVVNNVTFSAGMTTTGTGNLIVIRTSTLTSNGVQLSGGLTFAPDIAGSTGTFADNWTIVGSLTRTGAIAYTIAGSGGVRTINVQGSFTGGSLTFSSITLRMTGTGNLSGGMASSSGNVTFEINTAGTISHNGTFSLNGIIFTYTSGTFNSTATLACGNNTVTFNNWGNINRSFSAFDWNALLSGQAITLNSNVYITNNVTFTGNSNNNVINGAAFKFYVGGSITGSGLRLSGTASIELIGSTNASITIGTLNNSLTIDKNPLTTLTLNSFIYGQTGGTLTYTNGLLNLGTSTITISANNNCTINNMTFWNLTIPGLSTITQNVANTIQNNLTLAATNNVTFAGTAGWTCANLICTTPARTITLQNSITYTTTTFANMVATAASPITMTSSSLSIRAIWTLNNGASQIMTYINGTRIDSSGGQTIYSFGGVLTDTINWNPLTVPGTVAYTFVN
jgi:hypothetical protein